MVSTMLWFSYWSPNHKPIAFLTNDVNDHVNNDVVLVTGKNWIFMVLAWNVAFFMVFSSRIYKKGCQLIIVAKSVLYNKAYTEFCCKINSLGDIKRTVFQNGRRHTWTISKKKIECVSFCIMNSRLLTCLLGRLESWEKSSILIKDPLIV